MMMTLEELAKKLQSDLQYAITDEATYEICLKYLKQAHERNDNEKV